VPSVDEIRAKIRKNFPSNGVAKRNATLEWTRLGKDLLQTTCECYTVSRSLTIEAGPDGNRPWIYQAWRAAPKFKPKDQTVMPTLLGARLPTADAAKALCQDDANQQQESAA
jgi:hypothetical protein